MMYVLRDLYGEYPFVDEKYGIYQCQFGGGMEHQTFTAQGGFWESLTAHELGHQWWGDIDDLQALERHLAQRRLRHLHRGPLGGVQVRHSRTCPGAQDFDGVQDATPAAAPCTSTTKTWTT
jgi:hypothetical protein